jgi:hypothetical protein
MTEILNLPQDEKTRLMNAVNDLCVGNPEVIDQLEKLVKIKKDNPFVWKMLVSKIKNY